MNRTTLFLITTLAASCGQVVEPAATPWSLQGIHEGIVDNPGYQDMEQKAGRGVEKMSEFFKGDDGKINAYKEGAAEADGKFTTYVYDRTKVIKQGSRAQDLETTNEIESGDVKNAQATADLVDYILDLEDAMKLGDALQAAALELTNSNLIALEAAINVLADELEAKDASLELAIAELAAAVDAGDVALADQIVVEIARVDGDLSSLANKHTRDMAKVKRKIRRLKRTQRAFNRTLNYVSYRMYRLERRVGGLQSQAYRAYRHLLRKMARLARKVRINATNIDALDTEVDSIETLLNVVAAEVISLENDLDALDVRVEDLEEDADEPCYPGVGGWPFCNGFPF